MKKSKNIICAILLLTAIAVLLLWPGSNIRKLSKKATSAVAVLPTPYTPPADPMAAAMKTPFKFFGIILDQNGNPVVGAKVDAAVLNNYAEGGTPVHATSDAAGKFSIESQGMSLHVEVSKLGYDRIARGGKLKPSSQGFDFVTGLGRGVHHSDPALPVVFQLRKPENPVMLERLVATPKVPRDGTPVFVRLSKTSNVTLRIRCHTTEDGKTPIDPYNWRCEVDVEGGGIQDRTDETNFTAPEGGYAPSAVIDMPKTLGDKKWNSRATRNYWLRFPDNTFGRIEFQMIARGDHFADMSGYRNPTANICNLEPMPSDR